MTLIRDGVWAAVFYAVMPDSLRIVSTIQLMMHNVNYI